MNRVIHGAVRRDLGRTEQALLAVRDGAWLTDGMSQEHEAFLKRTVPTPVVKILGGVFGRRYTRHVAPVWRT